MVAVLNSIVEWNLAKYTFLEGGTQTKRETACHKLVLDRSPAGERDWAGRKAEAAASAAVRLTLGASAASTGETFCKSEARRGGGWGLESEGGRAPR